MPTNWDHLRKPAEPVKQPIQPGNWRTAFGSGVTLHEIRHDAAWLSIGSPGAICTQKFGRDDLTEFIEFLTELREQLK